MLADMGIHRSVNSAENTLRNSNKNIKNIKDHNVKVSQTAKLSWCFETSGTLDSTSPAVIFEAMMSPSSDDQHGNIIVVKFLRFKDKVQCLAKVFIPLGDFPILLQYNL